MIRKRIVIDIAGSDESQVSIAICEAFSALLQNHHTASGATTKRAFLYSTQPLPPTEEEFSVVDLKELIEQAA